MTEYKIILKNLNDTNAFAKSLAMNSTRGDFFALDGDLGAGKTAFSRFFIRAYLQKNDIDVPSPTFTLVQTYTPTVQNLYDIWHMDCYRLEDPEEVLELGMEEMLDDAIFLVEWPEKIAPFLPQQRLNIHLKHGLENDEREVTFSTQNPNWNTRLRKILINFFLNKQMIDPDKTQLTSIKADASSRAFTRIHTPQKNFMMMEASYEENRLFLNISKILSAISIHGPKIDQDLGQTLILEDFGNDLFASKIKDVGEEEVYKKATEILISLYNQFDSEEQSKHHDLKTYSSEIFIDQLNLLCDIFDIPQMGKKDFENIWKDLLNDIKGMPQTLILRDYHLENIMWLDQKPHYGLIDFQDAGLGPVGYDLISLLYDCRRKVSQNIIKQMTQYYGQSIALSEEQRIGSFSILNALRQIRIIAVFHRLSSQGKTGYLQYLPQAFHYLNQALGDPRLVNLKNWFIEHDIEEKSRKKSQKYTSSHINAAMVLCAGFGKRMKPLTNDCPKPLLPIAEKPILLRTIDKLTKLGITKIGVNGHYLSNKIEKAVSSNSSSISYFHEEDILETGGGVLNALPTLGKKPFFVINGDELWLDEKEEILDQMLNIWDERKMDALLLLYPKEKFNQWPGRGDFFINDQGQLTRPQSDELAPFIFTGIQILKPSLFEGIKEKKFSLNKIYDLAKTQNRLYGHIYDGQWFHVSTPEDYEKINDFFEKNGL